MFIIFTIYLGLVCYPTSIKAFLEVPEDTLPGNVIFNHTGEQTNCSILKPDMIKTYFYFNDTQLVVQKIPDLDNNEALCEQTTRAIQYECLNKDSGIYLAYTLPLIILAVDEFEPKFDQKIFSVFVKEEESKGTKVKFKNDTDVEFNNHISDEDCGDNEFKFQLHDNHQRGIFSISGSSIVTNGVIDYEAGINMYNVTLFAENYRDDSTQATKNTSSIITISIQDIDDMNPIFKHDSYTLHVLEENSSFVNTDLIVTPHDLAYDQDLGLNEPLSYSLSDSENFIKINEDTGAITLNATLDRENKASYSFQIKAVQKDSDQRFAVSQLNLIVDDINDNHAVFNKTTLQVTIPENLAKGSFIQVVQAFDVDEDINAKFWYVISGHILNVNNESGIISVLNSSALDRESNDKLTFQISTIPETEVLSKVPCPNCNITLNIELSDVNDNDPIFKSPYVFTLENNAPGQLVGQVSATDADKDENALIIYSIESQPTYFKINSSSGEITLASQTTLPTAILVKACDSPNISYLRRCSTVQVNIHLKDNSTISGHDINATVFENLPGDSFVEEVPFFSNQLKFELQTNNEFKLIKNLIKTKVSLDRESEQYYSLKLNVLNGSQIQESYIVSIKVEDVNDHAPKFDKDHYFFSLTEDMSNGSFIGNVTATDADDVINANVTYYIEGQNSKYFSISPTSGNISLLMMPDIGFTQQFLSLVVRAADSGQPSLQNITNVQIHVGNGNGTLRIQVGADKNTIVNDKKRYERSLTDILGVETVIKNTVTYGAGSVIFISGSNVTDGSLIPLNDLSRLVESEMVAIQELFMRKQQFVPPTDDNEISAEAIALIAVACVLFVGSVILTAVTYYKFKRYQRLQRLVHNLSRKNSIYETQETSIAIEDEVSEYERQDSISTQNLITDDKMSSDVPNGQVFGVDNPGYFSNEILATPEAPDSFQNTEPELDYVNAELIQPTTSSDTVNENKQENDFYVTNVATNEPELDGESLEHTEGPVNDELETKEKTTTIMEEDTSFKETDEPERLFVPVPPPLPEILPPLSKSSSSSELKDSTHKTPTDESKSHHYQNVLSELYEAVKKRSDGDEIDSEPKSVPPKDFNETSSGSLKVIDLDDAEGTEEPEPDYAKRVRFNDEKVKRVEDSDEEQPHLGHDLRNSEEIKSPDDSLNGETGTFVFGEAEITEF